MRKLFVFDTARTTGLPTQICFISKVIKGDYECPSDVRIAPCYANLIFFVTDSEGYLAEKIGGVSLLSSSRNLASFMVHVVDDDNAG